ncbi:hypothetical protein AVO41_06780 [Thiomicrospira sp. WB1]|nr:hypothetical protein AVO41_06780 [Thiomicrospira sp. WB1]
MNSGKRLFWLSVLLSVSLGAFAAPVQWSPQVFEDQWGKTHTLDDDTQWVVYSHHMDGNDWVKGAFNQLKLHDVSAHRLLYVADISGMPSLISKWMAVPAMQDYAFPIALVRDSQRLADWPRTHESVSVFELKDGQLVAEYTFASREALQVFLSMNVLAGHD